MIYQVKLPSCAYGGEGSMTKIKEIVAKEGSKKIVVFSDKGIAATGQRIFRLQAGAELSAG